MHSPAVQSLLISIETNPTFLITRKCDFRLLIVVTIRISTIPVEVEIDANVENELYFNLRICINFPAYLANFIKPY